jgi:hypothetical protein
MPGKGIEKGFARNQTNASLRYAAGSIRAHERPRYHELNTKD